MSRIGKLPISIVDGVEVTIAEGNYVTVKGPKGQLEKQLHPDMILEQENGQVKVICPDDSKNALWGLTRTLLNNMVVGVTQGYSKNLELVGVGYRAQMQGKKLVLQVGKSHPVEFEPEDGMEIEVPAPTQIVVKGIDKEKVGSRSHHNASCAITANQFVWNSTIYYWYFNQIFLCIFNAFTDCFWYFVCFTHTNANNTVFITNNNQSTEAHTATTFNGFRYTVDLYNFFF